QNSHALAVVEGCQCVGGCADLRLMAVDDVRDYEAEDGLDAGCSPQAFPERGGCVDAGGGGRACGCAHEDLLSNWIGCDVRHDSRTEYTRFSSNQCCDVGLSELGAMSVLAGPRLR